jgi:hypothetical protein
MHKVFKFKLFRLLTNPSQSESLQLIQDQVIIIRIRELSALMLKVNYILLAASLIDINLNSIKEIELQFIVLINGSNGSARSKYFFQL